jgi:hypothetical protein
MGLADVPCSELSRARLRICSCRDQEHLPAESRTEPAYLSVSHHAGQADSEAH